MTLCLYIQIADFGLSKKLADETEYYMTSGGKVPVKWTAPEVCVQLRIATQATVMLTL